jgi:hypothetical protein
MPKLNMPFNFDYIPFSNTLYSHTVALMLVNCITLKIRSKAEFMSKSQNI